MLGDTEWQVRTLTLARHKPKVPFQLSQAGNPSSTGRQDWNGLRVVAVLLGGTDLVTLSGQRVLEATIFVLVADLTNEILGGESVEAGLV